MMTHLKGNVYANIILHQHPSLPPTLPHPPAAPPVSLTTHHYLSLEKRQQKIIGVSNPCLFLLLFSGEIMLNIFFIDLFLSGENALLKVLCWSYPDAIRVTEAPSALVAAVAGEKIPRAQWGVN